MLNNFWIDGIQLINLIKPDFFFKFYLVDFEVYHNTLANKETPSYD